MTKKMPKAAVRPHRPIPPRTATAEEVNNMCTWAIVLSVLSLAASVTSALACAGLALR